MGRNVGVSDEEWASNQPGAWKFQENLARIMAAAEEQPSGNNPALRNPGATDEEWESNQPGGWRFQENLARIMEEEAARKAGEEAASNQPGGENFQANLGRIMGAYGSPGNAKVDFGDAVRSTMGGPVPYDRQQTSGDMSNSELYDTQFSNLLGQQNAFQNQQNVAAQIRQDAANAPAEPVGDPWDWYTNVRGTEGLPGLNIADAPMEGETGDAYSWNAVPGISEGMTNQEVLATLQDRGRIDADQYDILAQGDMDSQYWAGGGWNNPNDMRADVFSGQGSLDWEGNPIPLSDEYSGALNSLVTGLWDRTDLTTPAGGGPKAAPGYASPISG